MATNPLRQLEALGQSVWLDDLRRAWLQDGTLARLISEDGLAGVTSNPAIFGVAISEGSDYDEAIGRLAQDGASPREIYDAITTEDIRGAAELFGPLYRSSGGESGYVSLEVSPHLADDAEATVAEAHRLWEWLDHPNTMIKVPGTRAGLQAIRRLIADGVNVNVTLLFAVERYREVVEAFLAGQEERDRAGRPVDGVASVASFFLSRIDTLVDGRLDAIGTPEAKALRGEAAIASARLAYRYYEEWTAGDRWRALAEQGAHPQRLLWASTSTKDKSYSDVKYIEALVGADTISTMPPATLAAYRKKGQPRPRIAEDLDAALSLQERLAALGVDLDEAAETLEREGVRKFIEPYDASLQALAQQMPRPRS